MSGPRLSVPRKSHHGNGRRGLYPRLSEDQIDSSTLEAPQTAGNETKNRVSTTARRCGSGATCRQICLKDKNITSEKKKRKVPAETGCASSEGKQLRIKVSHGAMGEKGAT